MICKKKKDSSNFPFLEQTLPVISYDWLNIVRTTCGRNIIMCHKVEQIAQHGALHYPCLEKIDLDDTEGQTASWKQTAQLWPRMRCTLSVQQRFREQTYY
jgi:hypothetical protein